MTKNTVAIAPEAALRALSAENEWRRNRILVLENQIVLLEREIEAAKARPADPEPEDNGGAQ